MKRWLALLLAGTLAFSTLPVYATTIPDSQGAQSTENVQESDESGTPGKSEGDETGKSGTEEADGDQTGVDENSDEKQNQEEDAGENISGIKKAAPQISSNGVTTNESAGAGNSAATSSEDPESEPDEDETTESTTESTTEPTIVENKESIELTVGETQTLEAEINTKTASTENSTAASSEESADEVLTISVRKDAALSAASDNKVEWSSENEDVATVDSTGKVTAVGEGKTYIDAVSIDGQYKVRTLATVKAPHVYYSTHVQNIGWQSAVSDGVTEGTTGRALRLEGIKIYLSDVSSDSGISYSTHIQNIGWQSAVKDNALSGTTGKALRLEAIRISLYGSIADQYDIYYRVHAQNFGWLGWAKNGANAGTSGYAYRLEAIQIKLVKKGAAAPGSTSNAFHSQGWTTNSDGTKSFKVDGVAVIGWKSISGKWYYFNSNGIMQTAWQKVNNKWYYLNSSGVMLTGWQTINGSRYYLYSDGHMASNTTIDGWTIDANGVASQQDAMDKKAQGYSSNTKYLILVNKSTHILKVYYGSKGKWEVLNGPWKISCGKSSSPTPSGSYKITYKAHKRDSQLGPYGWLNLGKGRCAYCLGTSAGFYLHSVIYTPTSYGDPFGSHAKIKDGRLGYNISVSCVRVATTNAKWLYYNIPVGTKVVTYK